MGEFVFAKAIAYSLLLQKTWLSSQTTILLNSLSHFFAVFSSCCFQSSEAVARRYSVRKSVLRNFAKFTGKHLYQSLFLNKVAGLACNFIEKEIMAQVFSCESYENSKNTIFTEQFWATASESYAKRISDLFKVSMLLTLTM